MSVFALADLHLSLSPNIDKPMDIYGSRWFNHINRLKENWEKAITEEDTIIIAGDISWALKLDDAVYDLDWIERLPGEKVIFKGNHDLWWSGITKLNNMYDTITFVQNTSFCTRDFVICGTRGWITPDNEDFTDADEKVYRRELLRLESSLKNGKSHIGKEPIVIMHYPPVSKIAAFSGFQRLFEEYNVKKVYYGHIHGEEGFKNAIMGNHHGVEYKLISLDYINCKPVYIGG